MFQSFGIHKRKLQYYIMSFVLVGGSPCGPMPREIREHLLLLTPRTNRTEVEWKAVGIQAAFYIQVIQRSYVLLLSTPAAPLRVLDASIHSVGFWYTNIRNSEEVL